MSFYVDFRVEFFRKKKKYKSNGVGVSLSFFMDVIEIEDIIFEGVCRD